MTTPEEQELQQTLHDITEKTRNGDIAWTRTTPTTFSWIKKWDGREGARVSIQKVSKRERVKSERGGLSLRTSEHYIFQVTDAKTKAQMLTLSTEDNTAFMDALANLYAVASTNISKRGLAFLKKALSDIPSQ